MVLDWQSSNNNWLLRFNDLFQNDITVRTSKRQFAAMSKKERNLNFDPL